jgi:hypothetical protein
MMISRGKEKSLQKKLLQCQFIHNETHMKPPGIEPRLPKRRSKIYIKIINKLLKCMDN